ncbi:MAG: hypothetical protein OXQ89_10340 [Rhodospirillaceae bacterium]|nr:hypothetical protein [Rhodospirillaceae bacterium]
MRDLIDAHEGFRAGRPLQGARRATTLLADPVTERLVRLGLDGDGQGAAIVVGEDKEVDVGRFASVAVDRDSGFGFRRPVTIGPDVQAAVKGVKNVGLHPGGRLDPGPRVLFRAATVLPVQGAFWRRVAAPVLE